MIKTETKRQALLLFSSLAFVFPFTQKYIQEDVQTETIKTQTQVNKTYTSDEHTLQYIQKEKKYILRLQRQKQIEFEQQNKKQQQLEREKLITHLSQKTRLNKDLVIYILNKSKEYQIHYSISFALFYTESRYNPKAISSHGAVGFGQLLPNTAKYISEKTNKPYNYQSLFNPYYNIDLSLAYLRYLIDKFDNISIALTAYNQGPTNVIKKNITTSSYSKYVLKQSYKY
ncbi:MAG: transglycosylase SLT domain-containing protein [Ignavibacterium sp.]|nr:transglycosylase SLT domain-containing protein [Ignavibacterium sp.]